MQLMAESISVLGSRHGLLLDPVERRAGVIRYDWFDRMPSVDLRAGVAVGGQEVIFPLGTGGEDFTLVDMRITPCTVRYIGIFAPDALKVTLTFVTPFRPRDADFSTIPVLGIRLEAEPLEGRFRWVKPFDRPEAATLFLEIAGGDLLPEESGHGRLDLTFTSTRTSGGGRLERHEEEAPQRDRLLALTGGRRGRRFERAVDLTSDERRPLEVVWCTHDATGLTVLGEECPFRYARRFADLDAVTAWAGANGGDLLENAARVDGIVRRNSAGPALNHLLAQTLHAWLMNTWWVDRGEGEWFTVWEGSCYFHSTVDVEYTQAPFYLAVWPELLGLELDQWPHFSKPGEDCLGGRGAGTLFASHDSGRGNRVEAQSYTHEMEVEETANYLILAACHWRRTGDDGILRTHTETIRKYLAFLEAADSTGNGVPDTGVANTVDDGSPAVQYGREQVYLAVKTAVAFRAGALMLGHLGEAEAADAWRARADRVRDEVETRGWLGDHYAVAMDRSASGLTNPWTGEGLAGEELPGWDAPHIYTAHGLALFDMVGLETGFDEARIAMDLRVAAERTLREYGCVHSDTRRPVVDADDRSANAPREKTENGWVAMNLLRDIAAIYRGVDLRTLTERYWEWQVLTNTQEACCFFETFGGNALRWYPRGIAAWGVLDALGGVVFDAVGGRDEAVPAFPETRVPRLLDADWLGGACRVVSSPPRAV